jgi:hypothetical protein
MKKEKKILDSDFVSLENEGSNRMEGEEIADEAASAAWA